MKEYALKWNNRSQNEGLGKQQNESAWKQNEGIGKQQNEGTGSQN